ncbi:hypothetical protein Rumeso_04746 [Rubellimicrobium mesophilum DSM 19309]|uniref:Uncharacterized protein n=1 Tax=Rubellimicrobium mesophilum DSM 19309 TaxID=442562 RepID=A0A017HEX7_9RHOB|nr:hypothetical protein Rumeso_04746 [Rubellimicrobium mesophilum DSM 19309]
MIVASGPEHPDRGALVQRMQRRKRHGRRAGARASDPSASVASMTARRPLRRRPWPRPAGRSRPERHRDGDRARPSDRTSSPPEPAASWPCRPPVLSSARDRAGGSAPDSRWPGRHRPGPNPKSPRRPPMNSDALPPPCSRPVR